MSEILTKHGERGYLAKLFGVSLVTVRSALKGHTKSPLAQRIREEAKARGGMEVVDTRVIKIKRLH